VGKFERIEHSTIIEAPVHEVFAYASDWQLWSDWFYGFTDCSPLTKVERGNGAVYSYKMKVLGFPFKLQTEIHNFVENKGWSGRGIKGVPHKTTWIFEDLQSSTKFTYVAEYALPIPILGSVICSLLFILNGAVS
jgi:uncharacterized protein YndB with AHSA1/START domain